MSHHWICTRQFSRWCPHFPFQERVPWDIASRLSSAMPRWHFVYILQDTFKAGGDFQGVHKSVSGEEQWIDGLVWEYSIPRAWARCHLHHECSPGGHRWCRGFSSDELLCNKVTFTALTIGLGLPCCSWSRFHSSSGESLLGSLWVVLRHQLSSRHWVSVPCIALSSFLVLSPSFVRGQHSQVSLLGLQGQSHTLVHDSIVRMSCSLHLISGICSAGCSRQSVGRGPKYQMAPWLQHYHWNWWSKHDFLSMPDTQL